MQRRKCTVDFLRVRRPWARPRHWNPSAALIYTGRWTPCCYTAYIRLLHHSGEQPPHNGLRAYARVRLQCIHAVSEVSFGIDFFLPIFAKSSDELTEERSISTEKFVSFCLFFILFPQFVISTTRLFVQSLIVESDLAWCQKKKEEKRNRMKIRKFWIVRSSHERHDPK